MHITTDNLVTKLANILIDRDNGMRARLQNDPTYINEVKYSVLLNGLNASTVLLTIAAAAAAFLAINTALVFGVVGLVARKLVERELQYYVLPHGAVGQVFQLFRNALLPQREPIIIPELGTAAASVDEWVLWMKPPAHQEARA